MLVDKTDGKLDIIKAFAATNGRGEQLQERLDYLANYRQGSTRCTLYPDFAPYSLAFVMELMDKNGQWERWFNGGLIFHGSHDGFGGGGSPTFSTTLDPADGWRVHT